MTGGRRGKPSKRFWGVTTKQKRKKLGSCFGSSPYVSRYFLKALLSAVRLSGARVTGVKINSIVTNKPGKTEKVRVCT